MCCGIRIYCKDGTVVISRTLEFGVVLHYNHYHDGNIKGIKASVPGQQDSYFSDGMNKYGITVMAFYFPKFIQYSDYPVENHQNIQSLEMVGYLLSNAKSIEDIYQLCKKVVILNHIYKPLGIVFPLHWLCCDRQGRCIVIECVNGKPFIYENPYGVMTNSPTFPEHIASISTKEVNALTPYNNGNAFLQGQSKGYSNGIGLIGLPGDYTSISRFVKLYILQKFHRQAQCKHDGLNISHHILNNFDIVKGLEINDDGKDIFTQYTISYTSTGEVFYKTYDDFTIKSF
jgi:choloylglycine hydrolase